MNAGRPPALRTALLFLITGVAILVTSGALVASDPAHPTTSGVAYGEDDEQVMDVFLPGSDMPSPTGDPAARPVLVLVHGGGWTSGSRAAHHPLASKMASRGWVAVAVDYRLAPDHVHPAAVTDVRAAVMHLRDHARDLGVSPRHIILAGESAGAHVAAMVALGDGPPDVAGLVAWSGLYELDQLPARVGGTPHEWLLHHLRAYLGCEDLEDGGCRASARDASPVRLASADDPPTLLLHSSDELAPLEDAQHLHDALRRAGVPSDLEVRGGSAHGRSLIEVTDATLTDFLEVLVRD